jgi:Domain of unknown function (DUF4278)
MKLQFLGSNYDLPATTVETVETGTELSFLGRSFKQRSVKSKTPQFPTEYLTYRGVNYKL